VSRSYIFETKSKPVHKYFWWRFPNALAMHWIAIDDARISGPCVSNTAVHIAFHKVLRFH
jgi:hypothetical protein